jgi:two-component system, NtrC family, nitrogen regulation sensor histidine kinase NtrY
VIGDWLTKQGEGVSQVHAEVELRSIDALLSRGVLLIAMNVAVVTTLWLAAVGVDGGLLRWLRRRWMRVVQSYRARLTLMLSLFFALPAALFALWTFTRVRDDDQQSRGVLAREALRTVPDNGALPPDGTSRFLFRDRRLTAASDAVLFAAAPFGLVLDDDVIRALIAQRRPQAELTRVVLDADGNSVVQAYRSLAPAASVVAMAPAVRDDGAFATRRADLLALVLAVSLIGVLGASWLGGRVARQLERPVNKLRQAVLALPGSGGSPGVVPAEFIPVFEAVQRTGHALTESRDLLEAARARTEAVLRNVASAVIAFDEHGEVLLANPRAERLPLRVDAVPSQLSDWPPVLRERVEAALAEPVAASMVHEPFGFDLGDRQWQGRLTRLDAGGVVVTLDDVTELARAERVIAWGEMARQVAHEIKNPLTPVRLGIQHLRRAWRDGRGDFGALLETNVERILNEIDHLDQIARQFSRFGAPPSVPAGAVDAGALGAVDPVVVAKHVVHLETLGEPGVRWTVDADDAVPRIRARDGELHEVLLNLCENARQAEATTVVVRVRRAPGGEQVLLEVDDDGVGIAPEHLSRIFEPQFSTRTSGTGLGLAICRRIVTGWGGTIEVESTIGSGTTMRLRAVIAYAPAHLM